MKSKYFVITLLVALLSGIVYLMLRFQQAREPGVSFVERVIYREKSALSVSPPDLSYEEWKELAAESRYFTKVSGRRIYVLQSRKSSRLEPGKSTWKPIFLKGFNLGAALPGCFPSEFRATEEQYFQWLKMMADLGANSVRVYTILPPVFYEAVARYNFAHADKPVYLIQGVWADIIEEGSYGDSAYVASFHNEIRNVIDIVHGNAAIEPRPGHASGEYTANVSGYTIAIMLGREWEPQTVASMRERFPERNSYEGAFFSAPKGEAMKCWIAEALDFTAKYETYNYQSQRALSFVNWLPLDPMYHDSEWIEWDEVREFDNDLETINPCVINSTPLFKAGYFASYHAYPYYPDFVFNDEAYRAARCGHGSCTYYGYLQDLVDSHKALPVVIAEFGIPSSRSAAHFQPQGMHQGGHSESAQGAINAHMIRDIHQSGCTGALLFAWIDEWFKHNWLVMDFELPQERNKLWHNLEDPEQNFGTLAMESRAVVIDGEMSDWENGDLIAHDPAGDAAGGVPDFTAFYAQSDATCLYLKLDFSEAVSLSDWEYLTLWLGIDTYDEKLGDRAFPGKLLQAPSGMEFMVEIRGPGKSGILVDEPYSVYTDYFRSKIPGYASQANDNGAYIEQKLLANRKRETLLGESVPEVLLNRSGLVWGSAAPGGEDYTSLADICPGAEGKSIELRLPWALLNVTDPSSKSVLADRPETPGIDIERTSGFRFYLAAVNNGAVNPRIIDTFPDGLRKPLFYSWDAWETPEYTSRLKAGAELVREAFTSIDYDTIEEKLPVISPSAKIAEWPGGAKGAVSVTFDDGSGYQYRYGEKLLEKYRMRGTFFVVTGWSGHSPLITGESGGLITRRLSIPQIQDLHRSGHEIGSHGHEHRPLNGVVDRQWIETTFSESQTLIEMWTGAPAVSVAYPYSSYSPQAEAILRGIGFRFGRVSGDRANRLPLKNPFHLFSRVMVDDGHPGAAEFRNILTRNAGGWTILQYHHLFPADAREFAELKGHDVEEKHNVSPRNLERQMRLLRNRNYAVAPLKDIGDYALVRQAAELKFTAHERNYVIDIFSGEGAEEGASTALTIELTSPWEFFRVEGSLNDGIYHNRTGKIYFEALPGSEIVISRMDDE